MNPPPPAVLPVDLRNAVIGYSLEPNSNQVLVHRDPRIKIESLLSIVYKFNHERNFGFWKTISFSFEDDFEATSNRIERLDIDLGGESHR